NSDTFIIILHSYDIFYLFFFNDPPTTEIYTLSLHDALPICRHAVEKRHHDIHDHQSDLILVSRESRKSFDPVLRKQHVIAEFPEDRKSTRLNSSHVAISYAVFCLKKKKKKKKKKSSNTY